MSDVFIELSKKRKNSKKFILSIYEKGVDTRISQWSGLSYPNCQLKELFSLEVDLATGVAFPIDAALLNYASKLERLRSRYDSVKTSLSKAQEENEATKESMAHLKSLFEGEK